LVVDFRASDPETELANRAKPLIWIVAIASLAVGCGTAPRSYTAPPGGGLLYIFAEASTAAHVVLPAEARDAEECLVVTSPAKGLVRRKGLTLEYSPYAGAQGADSFSYRCGLETLWTVGVTVDRISVQAADETDPIDVEGDYADDPAIWLHPTEPASSLILGTCKSPYHLGGLSFHDLDGERIDRAQGRQINNVDLRYGFELGGRTVDIVAASNRSDDTIVVFGVEPDGSLFDAAEDSDGIPVDFEDDLSNVVGVYGFCLYRSPASRKLYGFVTSKTGFVSQIELYESSARPGAIAGTVVRTFDISPGHGIGDEDPYFVEGCVADDFHEAVYFAEEDHGIWRYGAEPDDGVERRLIDRTGAPGYLAPAGDVEGLAIYQATESTGYLIASNQGDNSFVVYDRCGGNEFVAKFEIVDGPAADGINDSDGIEVISFGLGPSYEAGLFVAQDYENTLPGSVGNQNYKMVRWRDIATAIEPNLEIRTDNDPRKSSR